MNEGQVDGKLQVKPNREKKRKTPTKKISKYNKKGENIQETRKSQRYA